jgi:type I restriction enzyme S subunit
MCLASVDALLRAQVRKIAGLKSYKNGLMQQLFPAEGETVPKLRFPEFRCAGRWKEKKIGELLLEEERPLNMQNETEYSLVTVKRRYGGVVFRERLEGKSIKVKSQFLVRKDDFLISKRQIVHNACGIVPEELAGSIVSNEYAVFLPREECDIQFFNYFAQQPAVSRSFLASSVGIVIEKMLFKTDVWLRQHFYFPSLAEQKNIAAMLTSLDNLITLHTQKLSLLKAHKKGLMQQLFPSPEEVVR